MKKILIILVACMASLYIIAQPYVDPIHFRYTRAFGNSNGRPFSHLFIGPDFPFKMKKNRFVVLSPFFDNWNIDSASNKTYLPPVSSVGIGLSTILPLSKDKERWTLTLTAIPRFNSEGLHLDNSFQLGGVVLATYQKNAALKYKFGVYVNNEFFGLFVIPLAGIAWNIDDRNNLFGTLPNRLTFEHKLNDNFYTGVTFRTITNSYRLDNGNYLRIQDNQLISFLDFYAAKHIVFTAEAGYGIFRRLRSGRERNKNYLTDYNWGDGMFIKFCAAYRVRL